MAENKNNLNHASAVENLFEKYISDAKHEVKFLKRNEKMRGSNATNYGGISKEKELRKREKFGKVENESSNQSGRNRNKSRTSNYGRKREGCRRSFGTFENLIIKLANLFIPTRSRDLVTKDTLCHITSCVFCTDKNQPRFPTNKKPKVIVKGSKSLTVMREKLKRNRKRQQKKDVSNKSECKNEIQRKNKQNKGENVINDKKKQMDLIRLLTDDYKTELNHYSRINRSKFSNLKNANDILSELMGNNIENDDEEKEVRNKGVCRLGQGDGEIIYGFLNSMRHEKDKRSCNEEGVMVKAIGNLTKMIQFSRSQISYVVHFSNGEPPEVKRTSKSKTFSTMIEEAHFGGKPLIMRGSKRKVLQVNQPVDDEEFWSSGPKLSRVGSFQKMYEEEIKRNKEVRRMENTEGKPIEV